LASTSAAAAQDATPGQWAWGAQVYLWGAGFISTLGGAYRIFETDSPELNVLGGARYLELDTDLDIQIHAIGVNQSYSDSGSVWDGIVGVKGNLDLSGKRDISYYADVGADNSTMTWQALGAVNDRFSRVDAVLGYR
jgi:hypothetical protein